MSKQHYVKNLRIRNFSDPYCPPFGLNTERYSVSLSIQAEYGKIRTRKTPNTDTFISMITSNSMLYFILFLCEIFWVREKHIKICLYTSNTPGDFQAVRFLGL